MVKAAIHIQENHTVQISRHTRVVCKKEHAEEFNTLVREKVAAQTQLKPKEDGFVVLHKAITDAAIHITPQTAQN